MKTFLKLFPYIIQSIVVVEQIMSAAPGSSKKQVVLDVTSKIGEFLGSSPDEYVKETGILINTVVGSLNKIGFFVSKPVDVTPTAR